MKRISAVFSAVAAWVAVLHAQPAETPMNVAGPPVKGQVVFACDFNDPGSARQWVGQKGSASFLEGAVCISRTTPAAGSAVLFHDLPVDAVRGCKVRAAVRLKASEVSSPPQPWNGIKFMLAMTTPERKLYPQGPVEAGSFDWRPSGLVAHIPTNATGARLFIGLEEVTGKVWFDDIKITVVQAPATEKPKPFPGTPNPGHGLSRLRGAMVSPSIDETGLRVLGQDWNANLIRWQLVRYVKPNQPGPLADYDAWLEKELQRLDAVLPACERYGLYVAVDLHSPPGGKATVSGYVGTDDRLFTERAVQDRFVEIWRRIAARYKNARMIWGFDLANEPVEDWVAEDCVDWRGLAERAARAIREVDPQRTIIVEAPPWGGPESLADFVPLDLTNVVYSAHMYVPSAFTHQGVFKHTGQAYRYPGQIEAKHWDKAALEEALRPVIDFQQTYNVPIYIGEFSAIRWAPDGSAYRYLRDVIEIFEAYGWDWSYHAFREWQGWSVEHGSDRNQTQPQTEPTDRQRLLREWFGKNQKPPISQ